MTHSPSRSPSDAGPASHGPALSVQGLVKRYAGRAVVDGLHLEAARGAVTAVLGPNGAGKTTTLEICEGLRTADAGVVEVLGREPGHPELRSRVGVMLQEGGIYGSVTAREVLRHAAALYDHPQRPEDLLVGLGLEDVARTPARRLSGGQRQRLGVALAIVGRPELVFLDEPTAGLDPQSRRAVWDLITGLRASGVAVLLTTHYLEEAEQLADSVVIVDGGRAIAAGSPKELIAQAASTSVRFSASPGLPVGELVQLLPFGAWAREVSSGHYVVSSPDLHLSLRSVLDWAEGRGMTLTSVASDQRTLEDVFLDLTGGELRP